MQAVFVLLAGLVAVAQATVLIARGGAYDGGLGLGYGTGVTYGNSLVLGLNGLNKLGLAPGYDGWNNGGWNNGGWNNERVVVNSGWNNNGYNNVWNNERVVPYGERLVDRSGAITTGYARSLNLPVVSNTIFETAPLTNTVVAAPLLSRTLVDAPIVTKSIFETPFLNNVAAPLLSRTLVEAPLASTIVAEAPLVSRTLIAPASRVVYNTNPFAALWKKK